MLNTPFFATFFPTMQPHLLRVQFFPHISYSINSTVLLKSINQKDIPVHAYMHRSVDRVYLVYINCALCWFLPSLLIMRVAFLFSIIPYLSIYRWCFVFLYWACMQHTLWLHPVGWTQEYFEVHTYSRFHKFTFHHQYTVFNTIIVILFSPTELARFSLASG